MRGESARPGKRPLRALSASEKMDAIQRVHEGESKASVARDIGVPESTLRGWCKSEHKIRGMARNSSTPDSEAHSPASSSGANVAASNLAAGGGGSANLSSEDEGPCVKKSKLDHHHHQQQQQQQQQQSAVTSAGTSFVGDVCADQDAAGNNKLENNKPKGIDYVGLMTSMAGMRPENSSLLLQQLGLLSGATAGTLAKNLLSISPSLSHGSAVGLVENGLQYTKSNVVAACVANANSLSGVVGGNNKRHTISAIAPTQIDSVVAKSCSTRKSLPPAAEAPSTPVPASPRKTNENNSGMQRSSSASSKPKKDAGNVTTSSSSSSNNNNNNNNNSSGNNKKVDEALWMWLTQQQQLLGQQSASFNPSINQQDGSWFWQWYKQCSFPLLAQTQPAPTPVAKKSPSKARAMLDNVLCNNNNNNNNNNNENVKRCLNMDDESAAAAAEDHESNNGGDVPRSSEEAIEHGEKFLKWLDKCSEPAVTRLQIIQFKYLLDNLKARRKKSSSSKQSRK